MKDAAAVIDDFAFKVIAQREQQGLGNVVDKKEFGTDLLSLYMAVRDDDGRPMSRKALRQVSACDDSGHR